MPLSRLKLYFFIPKREVQAARVFVHSRTGVEQSLNIEVFPAGVPVKAWVRKEDEYGWKIQREGHMDEQISFSKKDFDVK